MIIGHRLGLPAFASVVVVLAACSAPAPEPAGAGPTAEVRVAEVRAVALSDHLQAYGDVGYSPKVLRVVDTTAEVIVEQVYASVGQPVTSGTPLLRIRPTSNSLLELNKAATDRAFARQESERIARLFSQQLATNADRAAATQALRSAEDTWVSAVSRIGDGKPRDVEAETNGVIASIDVERGDIAPADSPLVHLADTGMLQVRLGIEPSDLPRVTAGQSVTLSPVYDRGITLPGMVTSVVTQVDPNTKPWSTWMRAEAYCQGRRSAPPSKSSRGLAFSAFRVPRCCTRATNPMSSSWPTDLHSRSGSKPARTMATTSKF